MGLRVLVSWGWNRSQESLHKVNLLMLVAFMLEVLQALEYGNLLTWWNSRKRFKLLMLFGLWMSSPSLFDGTAESTQVVSESEHNSTAHKA